MTDGKRINIAMAFNSRFVRYAYVALNSLFDSAKPELAFHIYILHSDLTDEDMGHLDALAKSYGAALHYCFMDRSLFPSACPLQEKWPLEIYYRLMLPDLLPEEVDRLLYLDADIIVNQDLSELYFMDFEGAMLCACPDSLSGSFGDMLKEKFKALLEQGHQYFNSGVLLYNMALIRTKYGFADYLETAEKMGYDLIAPDQDILNYTHFREVKFLDGRRYNLMSGIIDSSVIACDQIKRENLILHFAGEGKPWNGKWFHSQLDQLWWDYAKKSPFYYELLEEFQHDIMNNSNVRNYIAALENQNKVLRSEVDECIALLQKVGKVIT